MEPSNETLHALMVEMKRENSEAHKGLAAMAKKTNGNVMENTKFRIEQKAVTRNTRWLIGIFFAVVTGALLPIIFKVF